MFLSVLLTDSIIYLLFSVSTLCCHDNQILKTCKNYFYSDFPNFRHFVAMATRLRNGCSDLNLDLYNNHLRADPYCACTKDIESPEHFFLKCTKYNQIRITPFHKTRDLNGNNWLDYNDSILLFEAVHAFIKSSRRFQ